jgi:Zn finger protein HypA/HybF involved in hydrogenase expression
MNTKCKDQHDFNDFIQEIGSDSRVSETIDGIKITEIRYMKYLVSEYNGLTKQIVATKNREKALVGTKDEKYEGSILRTKKTGTGTERIAKVCPVCDSDIIITVETGSKIVLGLETIKGQVEREITKLLDHWPIWYKWLKDFPGIGSVAASQLIVLYYYRFVAICRDCGSDLIKENGDVYDYEEDGEDGENNENSFHRKQKASLKCSKCRKKAKDDGPLKYRVERKNFDTVSKWWAYMGVHTVPYCPECNKPLEDRKSKLTSCPKCKTEIIRVKPRREKGFQLNWSTTGRNVAYLIGTNFNKYGGKNINHPFKTIILDRKARHEVKHPEWPKNHIDFAARNEAAKLFLSHFYEVARKLEGLSVSEPYVQKFLGHTNITKPFFLDEEIFKIYWGGETQVNIMNHKRDEGIKDIVKPKCKL